MQDHNRFVTIKELPETSKRNPLFIVGDVHGCAIELNELLLKARTKIPNCLILLVGDLFTKGPDPLGVFDVIQKYNALAIKGNHDWALISAILHAQKKETANLPEHTKQTLHLIRFQRKGILSYLLSLPHAYCTTIAPHRKAWGAYRAVIVHAGIDPLIGLANTTERMLLTARWVRPDESGQKRLVLINSSSRNEFRAEAVNVSRIMPKKARWHEFHHGDDLIIFGHDAKQGLFRKVLPNGRPICVGLDTGCTYGRALTGYFPEFDDALQVDSHRTYFDVGKNCIIFKKDENISPPCFEKAIIRSHAS